MDSQKQVDKIKEILTQWNPLGEYASKISDLNNYNTEANDIHFNIEFEIGLPTKKQSLKKVYLLTKEILEGAFNIEIIEDECFEAAIK
jgi:hypothetical protein